MRNLSYSSSIHQPQLRMMRGLAEKGVVISELCLLALTLASALLFVMTAWCLAANLGLAIGFPIAAGPLSNWLVWSCITAATEAGRRTFEKRREIVGALAPVVKLHCSSWMHACGALVQELHSALLNATIVHRWT